MSNINDNKIDRRCEIINACLKLYEKVGFNEITIKDIAAETTFSRPSIYNYFQTKEEIFLAILQNEYIAWTKDIKKIIDENEKLTKTELISKFSKTISFRIIMLKLMAMNLYDIEENSSIEALIEFKKVYSDSIDIVKKLLRKFVINITEDELEDFIYMLYPFMYGLYPYTNSTKKQIEAMKKANVIPSKVTVYDVTYKAITKMLN